MDSRVKPRYCPFADSFGSDILHWRKIERSRCRRELEVTMRDLIPSPIDQNPCAHWRSPMDMMVQGWSVSLFQA
ncbi:hypothetical protein A6A05_08650 [Magnetospirillum moscoviense]|uniref:Uncharacterized protein n=1 Tax=Magnetospirillum moscoviense TaxID=1437059 RepID=A0A178MY15_9PROT|nr:hypothetical protein A6A05_08650 [Magnetospirillum moscoviense]